VIVSHYAGWPSSLHGFATNGASRQINNHLKLVRWCLLSILKNLCKQQPFGSHVCLPQMCPVVDSFYFNNHFFEHVQRCHHNQLSPSFSHKTFEIRPWMASGTLPLFVILQSNHILLPLSRIVGPPFHFG